ncbi:hypothetical protein E3P99_03642 [Wallemia hederae]|uniref:Uncharacterized protein n=1 Tax=Wallemia hederae TaxID=1540922 RepID=A0A4T0FEM9_9BASI|nr:hypothetical protein E3P99_03642 [Wallemia hederae]
MNTVYTSCSLTMTIPNKSVHYLRVNEGAVMQCIVYLDNKHLEWFNRAILNDVIHDIRRLFIDKLLAEMSTGKAELDTFKNNNYQFAYYFRPTRDKQGIVSKKRKVSYVSSGKRTIRQESASARGEEQDLFIDDDDEQFEEKPKPKVETSYKMLKLFTKTLCIIIEPCSSLEESSARQPLPTPSPPLPELAQATGENALPDSLALDDTEDVKPDINAINTLNGSPQLPTATQALFEDFNFNNAGSSLSFPQIIQNDNFGDRVVNGDDDNDVVYE